MFVPVGPSVRLGPWLSGSLATALVFGGAALAVRAAVGQAEGVATDSIRADLIRLSRALAAQVDVELHAQLDSPEETDGETYLRAVEPLRLAAQSDPTIAFVYTLVDDAGTVRFVLDGAPAGDADGDGVEDRSGVWEEYPDADPSSLAALAQGVCAATEEPYSDAWGTFMSAYAPLFADDGSVSGVLGVDVDVGVFLGQVASQRRAALLGLVPAAALAAVVGLCIGLLRRRQLSGQDALGRAFADLAEARGHAERANRAKSEFLANMSHEIRTPLTAILGYAELLRDDPDEARPGPEPSECVGTIVSSGRHLLHLVDEVLDLTKIEVGHLHLERIATDLAELLGEVVELGRGTVRGDEVTVEFEYTNDVPTHVQTDPTRLRQILVNLIGNAAKFTERGEIRLEVAAHAEGEAQRLYLDVVDTGTGMTREEAGRVFDAFAQADTSVTRRFGGTGLGLTISRRLARLMGGDVALVHTAPGEGTRFRVDLLVEPADAPSAARSAPVPDASGARVQGRVLVAEDTPVNLRLISAILRRAGATVTTACDGTGALAAIEAAAAAGAPIEVLFTDMQMPGMDGYELVRQLRDGGWELPIVALTAHAMAQDRARCIELGCDDYATKPIDSEALVRTCARWLDSARRRAA